MSKIHVFNDNVKGLESQKDVTLNVRVSFDINITNYVRRSITAYGTIEKAKREYVAYLESIISKHGVSYDVHRTSGIFLDEKEASK